MLTDFKNILTAYLSSAQTAGAVKKKNAKSLLAAPCLPGCWCMVQGC